MSTYYYNGELYHHGVMGQKWGVQNGPPYPLDSGVSKSNAKRKFDTGKITGKIKSAAGSVKSKVSSKITKNKEKKQEQPTMKKDISKMSNDELRRATERMNLEANYNSAYSRANPKTVSAGKKFMQSAGKVVSNSVKTAAQDALTKKIRSLLTENDPTESLKKEVDELKLKSQKSTYENNIATNNEKAAERTATAKYKSVADRASTLTSGSGYKTSESVSGKKNLSSYSFTPTSKSGTRFTANLTKSERSEVNAMRKTTVSEASHYVDSDAGRIYVQSYEDYLKKH